MSEDKVRYLCDPRRNNECHKNSCFIYGGPCRHTLNKEHILIKEVNKNMKVNFLVLEGGECTYKSTVASLLAEKYSAVIHKRQRIANRFEMLRRVVNDVAEQRYRTSVGDERLHIFDRWELISDIVYEKYQYKTTSILEPLLPLFRDELEHIDALVIYLDVSEGELIKRFNARGDELVDLDLAIQTLHAYKTFFATDSSPHHFSINTTNKTSQQVADNIIEFINILEGM